MRFFNIFCVALIGCATTIEAFQRISYLPTMKHFGQSAPLYSSKEEEIAKLEEQLRQLKAEQDSTEDIVTAQVDENSKTEEAEEVVPESMFLSEGWKTQEGEATESEGSSGFGNILGAIGLAVFIAIFSQIPIGQEGNFQLLENFKIVSLMR